jgi:hypothetical protein
MHRRVGVGLPLVCELLLIVQALLGDGPFGCAESDATIGCAESA